MLGAAQRPSLFDKKSRFMVSSPILLGVQLLDLSLKITLFIGATLEHLAHLRQEFLFPRRDLFDMDPVLLRQLSQRLLL